MARPIRFFFTIIKKKVSLKKVNKKNITSKMYVVRENKTTAVSLLINDFICRVGTCESSSNWFCDMR